MPFGRINKTEKDQIEKQHLPLLLEALHQPRPVDCLGTGAKEVHDVGAIVSLAFHDERFLPEQLFDGRDLDGHAEYFGFDGVVEPSVVYATQPIAGAENEIYMIGALLGLREPVGKRDLRPVAGESERLQRFLDVGAADEEIEVLRLANDPGVVQYRVGSPDEDRDGGVAGHGGRAA